MSNPLTTHVLIYGVTVDQFDWYRYRLTSAFNGVQPAHIRTHHARQLTTALPYIYEHADLELVYFPLEWVLMATDLDAEIYALWKIAEALQAHQNKPWATAPSTLKSLVRFFRFYGTGCAVDDLDICVLSRWDNVTKRKTFLTYEPEE